MERDAKERKREREVEIEQEEKVKKQKEWEERLGGKWKFTIKNIISVIIIWNL